MDFSTGGCPQEEKWVMLTFCNPRLHPKSGISDSPLLLGAWPEHCFGSHSPRLAGLRVTYCYPVLLGERKSTRATRPSSQTASGGLSLDVSLLPHSTSWAGRALLWSSHEAHTEWQQDGAQGPSDCNQRTEQVQQGRNLNEHAGPCLHHFAPVQCIKQQQENNLRRLSVAFCMWFTLCMSTQGWGFVFWGMSGIHPVPGALSTRIDDFWALFKAQTKHTPRAPHGN